MKSGEPTLAQLSEELARAFPTGLPVTQGLIVLRPADLQLLLSHTAQQAAQAVAQQLEPLLLAASVTPSPREPIELPTPEAARYLGVKPDTLLSYHREGLPFRKGRPNHYQVADLDAFRRARTVRYPPT